MEDLLGWVRDRFGLLEQVQDDDLGPHQCGNQHSSANVEVMVVAFQRSPAVFQQALAESQDLHSCRSQLARAGKSFRLPDTEAKLFAPSEQADHIQQYLETSGVLLGGKRLFLKNLKSWHVIVHEEYAEAFWRVIRTWPGSGLDGGRGKDKVKPKYVVSFHLDTGSSTCAPG